MRPRNQALPVQRPAATTPAATGKYGKGTGTGVLATMKMLWIEVLKKVDYRNPVVDE